MARLFVALLATLLIATGCGKREPVGNDTINITSALYNTVAPVVAGGARSSCPRCAVSGADRA